MHLKSFLALTGIAVGGMIAISAPAQAGTLSFSAKDQDVKQACDQQSTCTVKGFFTLTATSGKISVGGNPEIGIGVDNGQPANVRLPYEIEPGEELSVGFDKAAVLKSLQLNKLYPNGHDGQNLPAYGDKVYEAAIVTDKDGTYTGTLTVTGNTSAVWSFAGGGQVFNRAASVVSKGGRYEIVNPFAGERILGFSLKPVDNPNVGGKGDSDFALYSASVSVPEPATVLGLGVVGLLAAARRRSAKVS